MNTPKTVPAADAPRALPKVADLVWRRVALEKRNDAGQLVTELRSHVGVLDRTKNHREGEAFLATMCDEFAIVPVEPNEPDRAEQCSECVKAFTAFKAKEDADQAVADAAAQRTKAAAAALKKKNAAPLKK